MAQADTLRWQGEQDKIGPEHVAPMVEVARAVLLAERRRRATVGESDPWVFPAPEDSQQPDPEAMRLAPDNRGVLRDSRAP